MDQVVDFLFSVAQVFLEIAIPILVVFVIKWVKAKISQAEAWINQEPDLHYLLEMIMPMVVKAAEQQFGDGEEKLQYAVNLANMYLHEHGVDIDIEMVVAAVEAAVMEEFPNGSAIGREG